MTSLKSFLEKPFLIWFLCALAFNGVFWWHGRFAEPTLNENRSLQILQEFANSSFPPKIDLIRTEQDYGGHLAYYAVMGRVHLWSHGDMTVLRAAGMAAALGALFVFVLLGLHFTYRNRLNPLWVSLATLLFAANPYFFDAAMHVSYISFFLLTLLFSLWAVEQEEYGIACVFLSGAVLVDWRAVLLTIAAIWTRFTGELGRFVRVEKVALLAIPLIFASMPLFAWKGLVPNGETREWWHALLESRHPFRADFWFYSMAILPLYTLFFTWAWGFRARARAMVMGAIVAAVLIPFYFIFFIHPQPEPWGDPALAADVPLGLIDWFAIRIAGPYKNLVLFVPWVAGAFLLAQAVLMDVLERSRILRFFILIFFLVAPVSFGILDQGFLIVLPFILLLSLSEAMVGDEGRGPV